MHNKMQNGVVEVEDLEIRPLDPSSSSSAMSSRCFCLASRGGSPTRRLRHMHEEYEDRMSDRDSSLDAAMDSCHGGSFNQ